MSKAKTKEEMKQQMKKQMIESEPVFKLKVLGSTSVMCKYVGIVENKEKLTDETIELESSTGALNLPDRGKYEIIGRACACNIPGTYMLKHKKYPVYYMTLLYATQLVSGYLFNIYLYFSVDERTSSTLLIPKNYMNRMMTGKFTIELVADKEFLTFMMDKKSPEIEANVMKEYSEIFESMNDIETEDLESKINLEVENRLDVYR